MFKRPRLIIGALIPAVILAIVLGWRALRTPAAETVQVPLRHGGTLAATIYPPRGQGPWPVILFRSPVPLPVDAWPFARRGYVLATQVTRRRASDPRPVFDRQDGYDTVEWLAQQPFCDGRVAVAGHAEVGYLAYLTASAAPPHLVSAFVSHAPASLFREGHRLGGIFRAADSVAALRATGYGPAAIEAHRRRDRWDEDWAAADFETHAAQVAVPIYHATGWYDPGVRGVLKTASSLQASGLPGARDAQRVLVRPAVLGAVAGDLRFPGASIGEDMFGWFEDTVKAERAKRPVGVRYYLAGPARPGFGSDVSGYRDAATWPPPGARPERWYLTASAALRREPPAIGTSSTAWAATVAPTVGGRHLAEAAGPADLSVLDAHRGVARFASAPLKAPRVLIGDVSAELFVPRAAGDLVVRLADVYPDGYAAWIAEGALRPSTAGAPALEAGGQRLRVDLGPLAVMVGAGHRLAVYLTGASRPALAPDPDRPSSPGVVFHDRPRPSAIILPVMPALPPRPPAGP